MNVMTPASPIPQALKAPYQGYVYTYPHKSAYRAIEPARSLADIWQGEPRENRFLYTHVPFCEMRCGFCNLFTLANPADDIEVAYVEALTREAAVVSDAADGAPPAQMALGGGTPTFLKPNDLARVFDLLSARFGADPATIPCSVETSPKTATQERLQLLAERGVERISIGVQSFDETEARAIGRPQRTAEVVSALDAIRTHGFRVLNIDLIYGAAEQTTESWAASIRRALDWAPEEIYLYPLYVRPRTGLDGRASVWDDHRLRLYRAGRDVLLNCGYEQVSMRHFQKAGASDAVAGEYSCQEDGMIGLGPGARSYTRNFHYAMDFAVSRAAVLKVLGQYIKKDRSEFSVVRHGITLNDEEKMRRYLLKSLLRVEGLDRARFATLFGLQPELAFPELTVLEKAGLLTLDDRIAPTDAGLERSDAIGPWLYSRSVAARMAAFEAA